MFELVSSPPKAKARPPKKMLNNGAKVKTLETFGFGNPERTADRTRFQGECTDFGRITFVLVQLRESHVEDFYREAMDGRGNGDTGPGRRCHCVVAIFRRRHIQVSMTS